MSIEKYAYVQKVFDTLISAWSVNGYKGLAEFIGVPYQTLMAWKKRGSIGDYAPFMDKGISRAWLETGEGEMLKQTMLHTSSGGIVVGGSATVETTSAAVDPSAMTLEQKLDWIGFGKRDKRFILEFAKLTEEEQEVELKRLLLDNIDKGRY